VELLGVTRPLQLFGVGLLGGGGLLGGVGLLGGGGPLGVGVESLGLIRPP
jgi:hypothetical protein